VTEATRLRTGSEPEQDISGGGVEVRLDDIVVVHTEAFPGFFMTQLGPGFLREYYRAVADYRGGLLLTEMDGESCLGFVAGFVRPAQFYTELRRRRIRLGVAALLGVLSRPTRIWNLLADYRRTGEAASEASGVETAELSSLGVAPRSAGRGVGSRLVRRFISEAKEKGARRVVLTTDSKGNDEVNSFYQRLGFSCARTFEARPGRWLNEYIIET
jgi:ribosomal protein S18 acetylase RimI-like enzyme